MAAGPRRPQRGQSLGPLLSVSRTVRTNQRGFWELICYQQYYDLDDREPSQTYKPKSGTSKFKCSTFNLKIDQNLDLIYSNKINVYMHDNSFNYENMRSSDRIKVQ